MNTPPKTAPTAEVMLRRLVQRHRLSRVEIIFSGGKTFIAVAYPVPWSSVVDERRRVYFADAGKTEFSIAEEMEISERAASAELCRVSAETIIGALAGLGDALEAKAGA